jgi:hypothetical protein
MGNLGLESSIIHQLHALLGTTSLLLLLLLRRTVSITMNL